MRNTSLPPVCRAYAQLNKAVRIRPTCGVPVGEGQNLTRTSVPVAVENGAVIAHSLRVALGEDRHGCPWVRPDAEGRGLGELSPRAPGCGGCRCRGPRSRRC